MMRKTPKYVEQPPCANCGGRHYGDPPGYCPYVSSPCVICGDDTIYACSDCAIDSGGKKSVHVCAKAECQSKHKKLHPSATPHGMSSEELGHQFGKFFKPAPPEPSAPAGTALDVDAVYKELRKIYCCKGAEFCRPAIEKAWKTIEQLRQERDALKRKLEESDAH